jgi:hypothetical protein
VDLPQAYKAALRCTVNAELLCLMSYETCPWLGSEDFSDPGQPFEHMYRVLVSGSKDEVIRLLQAVIDDRERDKVTIMSAGKYLAYTRSLKGPFHIARFDGETAHHVALNVLNSVLDTVWHEGDPDGWLKDSPHLKRMNVGKVASNFEAVRRYFREIGPERWHHASAIGAEIKWELMEACRLKETRRGEQVAWLTMQETCKALCDMSESQVRRHIQEGNLVPNGKKGSSLRITAESVGLLAPHLRRRDKEESNKRQKEKSHERRRQRRVGGPKRRSLLDEYHQKRLDLESDDAE